MHTDQGLAAATHRLPPHAFFVVSAVFHYLGPAFAVLLCLLPATATAIGLVVLAQIPSPTEIAGVLLVIAGVAAHRDRPAAPVIEPPAGPGLTRYRDCDGNGTRRRHPTANFPDVALPNAAKGT